MLALTFADKEDYSKIRENDHISIIGLKDFQPGKPLTAVSSCGWYARIIPRLTIRIMIYKLNGSKAGSALNTAH